MSSSSEGCVEGGGGGGCRRFCRRCLDCTSGIRIRGKQGLDGKGSEAMEHKAGAEDDVTRVAGYLEKKGKSRLVSIWRRYWFVLEGRCLMYYETQPRPSLEPSCKGSLTLTPATSVTVSRPSCTSSGHHSSYHEIYILNSSQLLTLRTKDVTQHKFWVQALEASTKLPVKDQMTNESSTPKYLDTKSIFPLQPSTKHFRYSLTNLTTSDEKKAVWSLKSSHSMDNRNPNVYKVKSGSVDDIIDRYVDQAISPPRKDEDSASEEDEVEEILDKTSLIGSDDEADLQKSPEYCLPMVQDELPLMRSNKNEANYSLQKKEYLEEINSMYVDYSEETYQGSQLIRHSEIEKNVSKTKVSHISESMKCQAQESKLKSRKFFNTLGIKDSKKNDGLSKCQKSSEVTHKHNTTLQSLPKDKEKQKAKYNQDKKKIQDPKDVFVYDELRDDHEGSEFINESKNENNHLHPILPPRSSLQTMVMTSELKSPKKVKKKKAKKKKDGEDRKDDVDDQPSIDILNNRKSKPMKDVEQLEERESKKKRKKISFFSKMLRGKKMDFQEELEDRPKEMEEKEDLDNNQYDTIYNPVLTGYGLLSENKDEASVQVKKPVLSAPKVNFGMKVFPTDDAELKRKLESRIARMESEQNSSSDLNITPKLSRKFPVPTPRVINETNNKLAIPVCIHTDDSSGEDKPTSSVPSLPPRQLSRTPPSPPHDRPSNNTLVVTFSNPLPENLLQINNTTNNLMFPCFTHKSQISDSTDGANNDHEKHIRVTMGKKSRHTSGNLVENMQYTMNDCDELRIVVTDQESVSQTVLAATIVEDKSVSEADDGDGCRTLIKVCDTSISTNADFDTIQDSFHSPSKNSRDLVVNYKYGENDVNQALPNASDSNTDLQTVHLTSLQETSDSAVQKVDELSLLLSELDRINSSPLEANSGANRRPLSEEIKRVSTFEEDFITAFPIRRRRNSDPDYDVPRPHRLPHLHETQPEGQIAGLSPSTNLYDNETFGRQGTDSIVIEATRFFGPGMDFSFSEDKYVCLKEKSISWDNQNDENIQVMNFMGSGVERCNITKDNDVYLGGYNETVTDSKEKFNEVNRITFEEHKLNKEPGENCFHITEDELTKTAHNNEEDVVLRVVNIDKVCRNERSQEVYEDALNDHLRLKEYMEGVSIPRTLSKEEIQKTQKVEQLNVPLLTVTDDADVNKDDLGENSTHTTKQQRNTSIKEWYDIGEMEIKELDKLDVADMADSMSNMIQKRENTPEPMTTSAIEPRDWREDHGDINAGECEVLLRHKSRSEDEDSASRDHRTLRLSFATTETLLVEEEVLVATLKTTTTTTTTLPPSANDSMSNDCGKTQKVEEFVDETVLDMDQIADDHFGSIKVQSCVQT